VTLGLAFYVVGEKAKREVGCPFSDSSSCLVGCPFSSLFTSSCLPYFFFLLLLYSNPTPIRQVLFAPSPALHLPSKKAMKDEKEEKLWRASMDGDLTVVKSLLGAKNINVNWVGPERSDTPLHRACRFGKLEVAEELMRHATIDVNSRNGGGATPLFIACQQGHKDIVARLLGDPRVNVGQVDNENYPLLFVACQDGHLDTVFLLLSDPRVDVNAAANNGCTGLWIAAQNGHMASVQLLLASPFEVDTRRVSTYNDTTPAKMARMFASVSMQAWETEADVVRRKGTCLDIALLIDSYERDTVGVRTSLRSIPAIRGNPLTPSPSPSPSRLLW